MELNPQEQQQQQAFLYKMADSLRRIDETLASPHDQTQLKGQIEDYYTKFSLEEKWNKGGKEREQARSLAQRLLRYAETAENLVLLQKTLNSPELNKLIEMTGWVKVEEPTKQEKAITDKAQTIIESTQPIPEPEGRSDLCTRTLKWLKSKVGLE